MRTLHLLKKKLKGELHTDQMMRALYATDASVYRELPLAVAYPKDESDIKKLIAFARQNKTSIIPRAAGTSLSGQCVGNGIVVDVSQYMTQILEVNAEEGWVRVQPGVIRDELNLFLKEYGLFFGPNTSTANRAMIGGMVGNNSCGSYSIVYGTTRDHVLELKTILADGTEATFGALPRAEFRRKCIGNTLENQIYRQINHALSHPETQADIRREFPKPHIHRRNTGYAVDVLLNSNPYKSGKPDFNFCNLLTGSEGTLAFTTEIKIHCDPLPPPEKMLLCAHFQSVDEALRAVIVAMKHQPRAVELMDKFVMDCTKNNIEQRKNRFFIQGDPEAVLIIEFGAGSRQAADALADNLEQNFKKNGMGYAFPRVYPPNIKGVWNLRKAGLGLLYNIPGDAKPVTVVEDTAVAIEDQPAYIADFAKIMTKYNQQAVYYAHAGAGELHLRPLLNLKKSEDVTLFRKIGTESADLVKKYGGSLSGEHGDGRVRAEFLPKMVGEKNYQLLKNIKQTWDPHNIFNPGKIVNAVPMDASLRYEADTETPQFDTVFDFSATNGILRAAEKCNGSGDCRKTHLSGGTMCPSYMATRQEKDTTRARANILREMLTQNDAQRQENPFDSKEIYKVMDLCLSCKGCTAECPSSVDMATLKAEFLHQYYKTHGVPFRAKMIANIGKINQFGANMPRITNFFLKNGLTSRLIKKVLNIAPQRSLPPLHKISFKKWYRKFYPQLPASATSAKQTVYLFADEFTNFNDVETGIKAVQLLHRLGYKVLLPDHVESGRAYLSKGLLTEAKALAIDNVNLLKNLVSEQTPLIGIEPSAILSFRDEYPKLVAPENRETAQKLSKHCLLIDEFLATEIEKGNISPTFFTKKAKHILLHGHCHQKALSSVNPTAWLLGLPENYTVEVIPSGCCGMAGSFGYEAEHYAVSQQVGELVLFPAVRKANAETIIAAPGTSCRHQVLDGTGRKVLHPVEVLWGALVD